MNAKMQISSVHTTTFVTTTRIFLTVFFVDNDFHNDCFRKCLQFRVECVRALKRPKMYKHFSIQRPIIDDSVFNNIWGVTNMC